MSLFFVQCFLASADPRAHHSTRDLCELACQSRGSNRTCMSTGDWAATGVIPGDGSTVKGYLPYGILYIVFAKIRIHFFYLSLDLPSIQRVAYGESPTPCVVDTASGLLRALLIRRVAYR